MPDGLLIAVLAAGASRRLGKPKQLVSISGEPLLRRQCRIALDARIAPATVILGCHANDCAATIPDLPVAIRLNDEWEEGLASSIRAATRAAMEKDVAGLLVFHCDQYRLTAGDLRRLHSAWLQSGGFKACRSRHDNYVGPPVILPAPCFPQSLLLRGGDGARRVVSQHGANMLIDIEMPNAAYDLDVPEQLTDIEKSYISISVVGL